MRVIHLSYPLRSEEVPEGPIILALGFFDGVHRGHQAVLQKAQAMAQEHGLPLAVLTFNQHPKIVYQEMNPNEFNYLSPLGRKEELLQRAGVDLLYLVDFTHAFGTQSPQEFVDQYIVSLHAQVVVAGFDYTYGLAGRANMSTLPLHAQERFQVVEVPELILDQHKVGSTQIRQWIEAGQMREANQELGYAYQTQGVVIHGRKRGRLMGYPTANLHMEPEIVLPGIGIYAVKIYIQGHWYFGMASVGYNSTFESGNQIFIEVNVFDFEGTIYGETVKVEWYHYLRGEIKFQGMEDLIAQLKTDRQDTLAYFKNREEDHATE